MFHSISRPTSLGKTRKEPSGFFLFLIGELLHDLHVVKDGHALFDVAGQCCLRILAQDLRCSVIHSRRLCDRMKPNSLKS